MDREQTWLRLLDFARDVNADLDRCGFSSGRIMAGNPELCLTLDEWDARFERWIRTPGAAGVAQCDDLFRFPTALRAGQARRPPAFRLLRRARGNPLFLRLLAGNAPAWRRRSALSAISSPTPIARIRER